MSDIGFTIPPVNWRVGTIMLVVVWVVTVKFMTEELEAWLTAALFTITGGFSGIFGSLLASRSNFTLINPWPALTSGIGWALVAAAFVYLCGGTANCTIPSGDRWLLQVPLFIVVPIIVILCAREFLPRPSASTKRTKEC